MKEGRLLMRLAQLGRTVRDPHAYASIRASGDQELLYIGNIRERFTIVTLNDQHVYAWRVIALRVQLSREPHPAK